MTRPGTLWFVLALLTACHTHDHGSDHSHAPDGSHISMHEDELAAKAFTRYTDKTELFVEFKPLVVGVESRFAVHLTALGDFFTPVDSGSVTLTLKGDPGRQSVEAGNPDIPGLFRISLTPDYPGLFSLEFHLKTQGFEDKIIIDSVVVYSSKDAALDNETAVQTAGNTITFTKEQAWRVEFANMPVRRTSFAKIVKTSGLVASGPGAEQTVAARTHGIISFVDNGLIAGAAVRAGQHLFSISSKGFTADNAPLKLQEAKIALDKARADHDRLEKLLADQLTTQREFLQAKSELESAQVYYNTLAGNYGQDGQNISAVQSGYVKSLHVAPGQFVEAGQALAVITLDKRLTIKAELSQTAFAQVGRVSTANFMANDKTVYSLEELNGHLLSIGKFADNSMFIPVWFAIDNRSGIIPGTYIEVFIHADAVQNVLVIPVSALMEEQGNYYCYVQIAGESFEKRELLIGANDGVQVHVISGISEGDRVVTKGAYAIRLAAASGVLPAHGHEH